MNPEDAHGHAPIPSVVDHLESPMPNPEAALARLMDYIKPGSAARGTADDGWEPPAFTGYEDIRHWLSESVMSATVYERHPDGRWTIQLLLKEQNPGTYRYIVL